MRHGQLVRIPVAPSSTQDPQGTHTQELNILILPLRAMGWVRYPPSPRARSATMSGASCKESFLEPYYFNSIL